MLLLILNPSKLYKYLKDNLQYTLLLLIPKEYEDMTPSEVNLQYTLLLLIRDRRGGKYEDKLYLQYTLLLLIRRIFS